MITELTATLHQVTSFFGRIFPLAECRLLIRFRFDGGGERLGIAAAVCATVTVAAVSIFNIALAINPGPRAKTPIGQVAITIANHKPTLVSAADISGSRPVPTDPADALTFEARWARAPASAASDAAPLVPQYPVETAGNVGSLQPNPAAPPQSQAKPEIVNAAHSTDITQLIPAVAPASARLSAQALPPKLVAEWTNGVPLPRPRPAQHEIGRSTVGQAVSPRQAHTKSMLLPGQDSRTAVYDISARTIYLPSGDRLEAHSGLDNMLDDPRYVSVKNRGATPPNVYDLALRERLFHGVMVLRLNPVGGGNMFGRNGILAHHYMLGGSGQSNGCVTIKDYPAFLDAFLRGEVNRLVVVPHLENTSWRSAGAVREPARRYADISP